MCRSPTSTVSSWGACACGCCVTCCVLTREHGIHVRDGSSHVPFTRRSYAFALHAAYVRVRMLVMAYLDFGLAVALDGMDASNASALCLGVTVSAALATAAAAAAASAAAAAAAPLVFVPPSRPVAVASLVASTSTTRARFGWGDCARASFERCASGDCDRDLLGDCVRADSGRKTPPLRAREIACEATTSGCGLLGFVVSWLAFAPPPTVICRACVGVSVMSVLRITAASENAPLCLCRLCLCRRDPCRRDRGLRSSFRASSWSAGTALSTRRRSCLRLCVWC